MVKRHPVAGRQTDIRHRQQTKDHNRRARTTKRRVPTPIMPASRT